MKIYYLNDDDQTVCVYTNNLSGDPRALRPGEGAMFEFDAPHGSVPFVKVWWYGAVLLSYMIPSPIEGPRSA